MANVWAYGVTTVPQRRDILLPRTLASLRDAGFECPRLFVDGCKDPQEYASYDLEITTHYPSLRAYGNWMMALWELYLRNPFADRYAIFQDDLVAYRNLRQYLDQCDYPGESNRSAPGYWNLYTFPQNEALSNKTVGWHEARLLGKGGVGLVFNRPAVMVLLTSEHMLRRVLDPTKGWRSLDGAVVQAMMNAGWREYIHYPSLLQHTGDVSAIGNRRHPLADSFRGEHFDALEFIHDRGNRC